MVAALRDYNKSRVLDDQRLNESQGFTDVQDEFRHAFR